MIWTPFSRNHMILNPNLMQPRHHLFSSSVVHARLHTFTFSILPSLTASSCATTPAVRQLRYRPCPPQRWHFFFGNLSLRLLSDWIKQTFIPKPDLMVQARSMSKWQPKGGESSVADCFPMSAWSAWRRAPDQQRIRTFVWTHLCGTPAMTA